MARFSGGGGENVAKRKMCVVIFSTNTSETFFVLSRTERDMVKHINKSSCKVPVIHVRFSWNFNFLESFSSNALISNLIKSYSGSRVVPCGRTDGRTDMTKLIVAFPNFENVPQKPWMLCRKTKAIECKNHVKKRNNLVNWCVFTVKTDGKYSNHFLL